MHPGARRPPPPSGPTEAHLHPQMMASRCFTLFSAPVSTRAASRSLCGLAGVSSSRSKCGTANGSRSGRRGGASKVRITWSKRYVPSSSAIDTTTKMRRSSPNCKTVVHNIAPPLRTPNKPVTPSPPPLFVWSFAVERQANVPVTCLAAAFSESQTAAFRHSRRWLLQSARWQAALQYVARHLWQYCTRLLEPQRKHVACVRTMVTSTWSSAAPKIDASVSCIPGTRPPTSRVISRVEIERALLICRLRSQTVHVDEIATEHTYPLSIKTRTVSIGTSSVLLSSAAMARQQRRGKLYLRDDADFLP